MRFLLALLCIFSLVRKVVPDLSVVYAVNCGGQAHIDSNGIEYRADKNKVGTASDFGRMLAIARVKQEDQVLYQTERYHYKTFSYEVSLKQEGKYVLVLQFSEVYFASAGEKVFNVEINGQTIVKDLDIFERVGKGVAHNEVVPFSIRDRRIYAGDGSVAFDGKVTISFAKGHRDNPKINAFYIARGGVESVPQLPEIAREEDEMEDAEEEEEEEEEKPKMQNRPAAAKTETTFKKTSGPAVSDPYATDDGWLMPLLIALGVFVPTLFCLCRL